jgi:hypothetical protein
VVTVALAVRVAVTVAVNLKRRRRWRLFWVRFVAACTGHPARERVTASQAFYCVPAADGCDEVAVRNAPNVSPSRLSADGCQSAAPARLPTAPSLALARRSNDPWLICCEAKPAEKFNKTA